MECIGCEECIHSGVCRHIGEVRELSKEVDDLIVRRNLEKVVGLTAQCYSYRKPRERKL